jgi:hypothetical protein
MFFFFFVFSVQPTRENKNGMYYVAEVIYDSGAGSGF